MRLWDHFLPRQRIGTRIVAAVTLAMTLVLLGAGAFVFWRVQFALDRQLSQDLDALTRIAVRNVYQGHLPPGQTPGQTVQVYAPSGRLVSRSSTSIGRLATLAEVRRATSGRGNRSRGVSSRPHSQSFAITLTPARSPDGPVVVLAALSRANHDEALRELLAQLALTDLAAIGLAALVGHAAARAALGPVEHYRRAVVGAGDDASQRLPVDTGRDDELTRLGTTFNSLLDRIAAGQARERRFLADASHELRSPLAVLSAEVEWARSRARSSEQLNEVMSSVAGQVSHLADLADALLSLEELHSGRPPRRTEALAAELVDSGVAPHRPAAAAADRELRLDVPPAPVRLDPQWVSLAVGNLVANALKHGSGTVRVTGAVQPTGDGDVLRLSVLDQGGGIPASLGERAFERFSRAETSRTTPGHGLGLAMVRAVAQAHGGDVAIVRGGVELSLPSSRAETETRSDD